jgi:hypothetical protein
VSKNRHWHELAQDLNNKKLEFFSPFIGLDLEITLQDGIILSVFILNAGLGVSRCFVFNSACKKDDILIEQSLRESAESIICVPEKT